MFSIKRGDIFPYSIAFSIISSQSTFKVVLLPSKKICFIYLNESLLDMMKNAFYFIWKALFLLKIFKFLSWLYGHVEQTAWLEKLISKFMTSQLAAQTITIYILPNIWRSKGNQIMEFGQLKEWNKRNIFL